jgi:tetratricopeptide (TPR) repeat protein
MSKDPSNISGRPGAIGEALEQANLALLARRLDEAVRLAAGVLKTDPDNVAAGEIQGTALLMQDRSAQAIEPLQRAAGRSGDPNIETLLGRALANVGRREEALTALRQATRRQPPFPQAFLEFGDQLSAAGRYDEAATVFDEGCALNPDALVLRVGRAYLHLKCNERAQARRQFEAVRTAAPERYDALVGLAWALAADGDYAAAAELFRQALAARPADAVVRLELAKCLLELGQRVEGEAELRTATGGDPDRAGPALLALTTTPHGRFFLRPSAAMRFLGLAAS